MARQEDGETPKPAEGGGGEGNTGPETGQGVELTVGGGGEGGGGVQDDPGISPSPLGAWTFSYAEPVAAGVNRN